MTLRYPSATWDPLGAQTEPRMTSHDILCFHTMVGTLTGTSNMFHGNGYGGNESHFGVGGAGETLQWQDCMYQADANLDGGHRVVSIETADYGGVFGTWNTNSADNVPAWTAAQLDRLVDITVWFCRKETHASCPSTWSCHKVGVPCVLIPDTKPGRRGIGYHRQGCDPYRVDGGEKWSSAYGKGCPGPARIKQLTTIVIPQAQKILAGATTEDWFDMATPAEIEAAIAKGVEAGIRSYMKAFFTDEQGTGDTLADEARERGEALVGAINEVKTSVDNLASELAPKA